jgi:hypothetical protein
MTASIPWFKLLLFSSSIEFSFNTVFFQISEHFHPFKGTTINLNVCRCTYECFGAEYCAHNLTWCCKVYYSNTILITILMWTLIILDHKSSCIIHTQRMLWLAILSLPCKNPIPLRGHLKFYWAGKILAQSCQMALISVWCGNSKLFPVVTVPTLSLLPGTCY